MTARARARVDQDAVRQLEAGEAELIVRGLSERVRIVRTDTVKLSGQSVHVRPELSGHGRRRMLPGGLTRPRR
jgi:hypothetical protein